MIERISGRRLAGDDKFAADGFEDDAGGTGLDRHGRIFFVSRDKASAVQYRTGLNRDHFES